MNKKVSVFLCIIFIISIISTVISSFYIIKTNRNYEKVKQEINQKQKELARKINENKNSENEIKNLEIKFKDEIEEQNIWIDIKEKINHALLN
ncbi:MAG: septum formation initiator family protein [bacterium]|nr:septum formation initiator family protein [bacterium]